MTPSEIRAAVFEAMDNACENGFAALMVINDADATVRDLIQYDADLEDLEPADVKPHVLEWRRQRQEGLGK